MAGYHIVQERKKTTPITSSWLLPDLSQPYSARELAELNLLGYPATNHTYHLCWSLISVMSADRTSHSNTNSLVRIPLHFPTPRRHGKGSMDASAIRRARSHVNLPGHGMQSRNLLPSRAPTTGAPWTTCLLRQHNPHRYTPHGQNKTYHYSVHPTLHFLFHASQQRLREEKGASEGSAGLQPTVMSTADR